MNAALCFRAYINMKVICEIENIIFVKSSNTTMSNLMWTNVLFEEFYWKFRFFSYEESCDAKRNRLRKTKPLLAELNCTNSKWELTVSAALISWILSAHYYHCWLKDRKCTDSHFRLNKKARDVFNCVLMQQCFHFWNTVQF